MRGQAAPDITKAPPKTDLTPIMVGGPAVESSGNAIRPPAFRPSRAPTRTAAPTQEGPAAAPRDAVDELNALLGGGEQEEPDGGLGSITAAALFSRVAARRKRDNAIIVGKPGDIHLDLLGEAGWDAEDGFVDDKGEFVSRLQAEEMFGDSESGELRDREILTDRMGTSSAPRPPARSFELSGVRNVEGNIERVTDPDAEWWAIYEILPSGERRWVSDHGSRGAAETELSRMTRLSTEGMLDPALVRKPTTVTEQRTGLPSYLKQDTPDDVARARQFFDPAAYDAMPSDDLVSSHRMGRTVDPETGVVRAKRVSMPAWVRRGKDLDALRGHVSELSKMGAPAQHWYENSSDEILKAFGGDKELAEKFVQVLAITSRKNSVQNNVETALRAITQWRRGEPIRSGHLPDSDRLIDDLLNKGIEWEGRKTNNFYRNLMLRIDPDKLAQIDPDAGRGVTMDEWMRRAFGFKTKTIKPQDYDFVEREVKRMARQMGWEPQQVQAAIWTAARGQWALAEEDLKRRGISNPNEGQIMKRLGWDRGRMNYLPGIEQVMKEASIDFRDALLAKRGQVAVEWMPGGQFLAGWRALQPEVQQLVSQRIKEAVPPEEMAKLFRDAGVPVLGTTEVPGYFEGRSLPGVLIEVPIAREQATVKGVPTGKGEAPVHALNEAIKDAVDTLGRLLRQESLGWMYATQPRAKVADQNTMLVKLGGPPTVQELINVNKVLAENNFNGVAISTSQGMAVLHFEGGIKKDDRVDLVRAIREAKAINRAAVDYGFIYTNNGLQEVMPRDPLPGDRNQPRRPDLLDSRRVLAERLASTYQDLAREFGIEGLDYEGNPLPVDAARAQRFQQQVALDKSQVREAPEIRDLANFMAEEIDASISGRSGMLMDTFIKQQQIRKKFAALSEGPAEMARTEVRRQKAGKINEPFATSVPLQPKDIPAERVGKGGTGAVKAMEERIAAGASPEAIAKQAEGLLRDLREESLRALSVGPRNVVTVADGSRIRERFPVNTVGKFGDYLHNPWVKKFFSADVLNTPVHIFDNRRINGASNMAGFSLRGYPLAGIFISAQGIQGVQGMPKMSPNRFYSVLLEEALHAQRQVMGRSFDDGAVHYLSRVQEIAAKFGAERALREALLMAHYPDRKYFSKSLREIMEAGGPRQLKLFGLMMTLAGVGGALSMATAAQAAPEDDGGLPPPPPPPTGWTLPPEPSAAGGGVPAMGRNFLRGLANYPLGMAEMAKMQGEFALKAIDPTPMGQFERNRIYADIPNMVVGQLADLAQTGMRVGADPLGAVGEAIYQDPTWLMQLGLGGAALRMLRGGRLRNFRGGVPPGVPPGGGAGQVARASAEAPALPSELATESVSRPMVPMSAPGQISTRSNQLAQGAQSRAALQMEASEEYIKRLDDLSGGRVLPHREQMRQALELPPMTVNQLAGWPAGRAVSNLDVIRAGILRTEWWDRWEKALEAGDEVGLYGAQKVLDRIEPGYHNLTATPGRALEFQKVFQFNSEVYKVAKELAAKNVPHDVAAKRIQAALQRARQKVESLPENSPMWTFIRKIEDYATGAKLSSPVTHAINFEGNLLTYLQRVGEKALVAGQMVLEGKPLPLAMGTFQKAWGTRQGFKDGVKKAIFELTHPTPKLESRGAEAVARDPRLAKPSPLPKYLRPLNPFRMLSASDGFSKALLRDSEINMRALELAVEEGHRGKALSKRVKELVEDPLEEWVEAADRVGLEYTYQAPADRVLAAVSKVQEIPLLGRILFPFVRTPYNIFKFQLQRTPLGASRLLGPETRARYLKDPAFRREFNAQIGMGTALAATAYLMVDDNEVTGALPEDQNDRALWRAQGKQPYSIKVGDRWVQYNRVQPLGQYLSQAAELHNAINSGDDMKAHEIAGRMITTSIKGLKDNPFLQGWDLVINLTENRADALKQTTESVVTGLVPNVLRDLRSIGDPVTRQPRGVGQAVQNMLPGASEGIPEARDVFGRERVKEPSALRFTKQVGKSTENQATRILEEVGWSPLEERAVLHFTRGGERVSVELQGKERSEYLAEIGRLTELAVLKAGALVTRKGAAITEEEREGIKEEIRREVARARAQVRNKYKMRHDPRRDR